MKYTPAGGRGLQLAGGFARYIQYRDGGAERNGAEDAESFIRYAAFRDRASPEGRLFDADGTIADEERRALVRHIRETTASRDGAEVGGRAFYRLVISPEDARGVDLRALTRRTMAQLEHDHGRGLPPWIAAEHRNTDHPHVHVILAARHKEVPGRPRTLMITKPRLSRMKESMTRELIRQHQRAHSPDHRLGLDVGTALHQVHRPRPPEQSLTRAIRGEVRFSRAVSRSQATDFVGSLFKSLADTMESLRRIEEEELRRQERSRTRGRGRGD